MGHETATASVKQKAIVDAIISHRTKFRRGSAGWATAYHVSLFGAAILSATAALLLKIPETPSANAAAILATIAALLTTLSSVGSFESKWHADRDAFYRLDELLLDARASDLDADKLRKRLHESCGSSAPAGSARTTAPHRPTIVNSRSNSVTT
jgi:hypothetical protein